MLQHTATGKATMKMLTRLPTLIVFNILSTDRQDNPLLAKPMPFQVLDRCWHSDALLEVSRDRLLQKGRSACDSLQGPCADTPTLHLLLYRSAQCLHTSGIAEIRRVPHGPALPPSLPALTWPHRPHRRLLITP